MSAVTRQSQEALRSMISVPEPLLTLPQPGQEPPTPTCGAVEDLLPQPAQQPKAWRMGVDVGEPAQGPRACAGRVAIALRDKSEWRVCVVTDSTYPFQRGWELLGVPFWTLRVQGHFPKTMEVCCTGSCPALPLRASACLSSS